MPLLKGHLDWMEHLRNEALSAGVDLSVCVLEYGSWDIPSGFKITHPSDDLDLIPTNPYPRQMLQAILAVEHLVRSGYKPADVCLILYQIPICQLTSTTPDCFWG